MNICVCISGQFRGDFSPLMDLKKSLDKQGYNTTFIFSLWKNKGNKVDGGLGFSQLHRVFEPDLAKIIPRNYYGDNLWNKFPRLEESLRKKEKINIELEVKKLFPDAIIDIEDEILNLEFPKSIKLRDKNSIKMLYKRWRCNEIKKNIETSEKFDLVIVLRPDIKIKLNKRFKDVEIIKKGEIVCPGPLLDNFVNDTFAIGKSDDIDKYCRLFSKAISNKKWRGIHKELYYSMESEEIKFRTSNNIESDGLNINSRFKISDIKDQDKFLNDLTNNNIELKELTTEQIESYYLYQYTITENSLSRLKNIIQSDISTRIFKDIKFDRNKFFFNEFFELINENSIGTNGLKDLVDSTNLVLNDIAKKNILMFFSQDKFRSINNKNIIERAFIKRDIENLRSQKINGNIPIQTGELLRDWALELEETSIEDAYYLISMAKIAKPNGSYIQRLYQRMKNSYEKTHH